MKKRYISATIFLLFVLITAFCGIYLGQNIPINRNSDSANWHQLLHDKLHITDAQDAKLDILERKYSQKKQYLEEQMRLANMELAEAIKADKSFSPKVQEATDKIHHAMGGLQKTTLEHLFEMRPILNDEQNQKLERMITDALYENK